MQWVDNKVGTCGSVYRFRISCFLAEASLPALQQHWQHVLEFRAGAGFCCSRDCVFCKIIIGTLVSVLYFTNAHDFFGWNEGKENQLSFFLFLSPPSSFSSLFFPFLTLPLKILTWGLMLWCVKLASHIGTGSAIY